MRSHNLPCDPTNNLWHPTRPRVVSELIHFGMELVRAKRTIFDVMSMLFTAVTFHELFKMAAMDGNSKLQFGQQ